MSGEGGKAAIEISVMSDGVPDGVDAPRGVAPTKQPKTLPFFFFVLGLSVALPWNAFIMSEDYFSVKYSWNVEFPFNTAYWVPSALGFYVLMRIGRKVPVSVLIYVAQAVHIVVLVTPPLMDVAGLSALTTAYFLTIILVILSGLSSSLYMYGAMNFATLFPRPYTASVLLGASLTGVLAVLLRVLTKAAFPNTPEALRAATGIMYCLCALLAVAALALFTVLRRMPSVVPYLEQQHAAEHSGSTRTQGLLHEYDREADAGAAPVGSARAAIESAAAETERERRGAGAGEGRAEGESGTAQLLLCVALLFGGDRSRYAILLRKLWQPAVMGLVTVFVTVALYPGMVTLVPPIALHLPLGWFVVIALVVYACSDFLGRVLPRWRAAVLFTPKSLWILVLARLLFLLMFVLCIKPRLVVNDVAIFVLISLLASTGGYCSTLVADNALEAVAQHEKDAANHIMLVATQAGVVLGSAMNWVLLAVVS